LYLKLKNKKVRYANNGLFKKFKLWKLNICLIKLTSICFTTTVNYNRDRNTNCTGFYYFFHISHVITLKKLNMKS